MCSSDLSPNLHRACRDACTTTSPALGPGEAATKEEAVNTDSNARFGGEVEWNVSATTISFRGLDLKLERREVFSKLASSSSNSVG